PPSTYTPSLHDPLPISHQRIEPRSQHPEPVTAPAAREPGGLLLGAVVEQLREQQPSLELSEVVLVAHGIGRWGHERQLERRVTRDRKSTRLNSSHGSIS